MKFKKQNIIYILFLSALFFLNFNFAGATSGTIDALNKQAKVCHDSTCSSPTPGTINFKPSNSGPIVIDDADGISGYAWGNELGWINMNPSNSEGVKFANVQTGVLTGYAWSQVSGWVNFAPTNGGVMINPNTGEFSGWAWAGGVYGGWIKFDCSDSATCVKTTWRVSNGDGSGIGGGNPSPPPEPTCEQLGNCILPPPPPEPTCEQLGNCILPPPLSSNTNSGIIENIVDYLLSNKEVLIVAQDVSDVVFNLPERTLNAVAENLTDTIIISIKGNKEVLKIISTPVGNTVAKTITTVGIVTGVSVSIFGSLISGLVGSTNVGLGLLRLWSLFLYSLGLKKRNYPWGTVYDSVTKQPLDPAYVMLSDINGKEVATSITDIDGQYGFLVEPGTYMLSVKKTNYKYPSSKLSTKMSDELYNNLYFGERVEIKENGEIITKNIPLDPENFDWSEFAKREQSLAKFYHAKDVFLGRMSDLLFFVGFIVSSITLINVVGPFNLIIFCSYVILLILRKFKISIHKRGKVVYGVFDRPLAFGILRVYSMSGMEITHRVLDKKGNYYCSVFNGIYTVSIEKKNEDESYDIVYRSEQIKVKNGVLKKDFKI